MGRWAIAAAVAGWLWGAVSASAARAADPQAEVDDQLAKLSAPPPQVEVVFDAPNNPRYKLLSGAFELDDDPLAFDVKQPPASLFDGKLSPGTHRVSVKLVYNEAQGSGLFEYTDYKLTVQSSVRIQAQKGLRSRLHLTVEVHPDAARNQRLSIGSHVDSEMLAKVDDEEMPELRSAALAKTAVAEATPPPQPPAPRDSPAKTATAAPASAAEAAPSTAPSPKRRAARKHAIDALAAALPAAAPVAPLPAAVPTPAPLPVAPVPAVAPESPSSAPVTALPVASIGVGFDRRMLGVVLLGVGCTLGVFAWGLSRRSRSK